MAKFLSFATKAKIAVATTTNKRINGRKYVEPWKPGTAGNPTSTVEISISCRNLADKDILSKSDPMVVVFHRPPGARNWIQMMRSEVIQDDLNPDFVAKVVMEYRFEQIQNLRFEVYDVDGKATKLQMHDSLGYLEVSLGQIVSSGDEGFTAELQSMNTTNDFLLSTSQKPVSTRMPSTIILTAEELAEEKEEVLLKIAGSNCGSWSGCFPPRTHFAVSKVNDAGKYLVVHRSRMARGRHPTFPPLKISSLSLCNGDLDRQLKIDIFQRKFSGQLVLVGSLVTTVNTMLKCGQEKLPLLSPNGKSCKGSIRVINCTLTPEHTFIDYLQNGTQIHCCFGIDFTCSNGDPEQAFSLHYLAPNGNCPNPYEQAITAVGNIVKEYDAAGLFQAWGFGAKIPPRGETSHTFPLTLTRHANCGSIPAVIENYRSCLNKVMLFGPTNFAPVIDQVAAMASKSKLGESYYVLVIVTDGVISDLKKTRKAIVDASVHPVSIIIIGVGEGDFKNMEELDGDAVRVSSGRKMAKRDIVQFVSYRSARAWLACTGETTMTDINQPQEGYGNNTMDFVGDGDLDNAPPPVLAPPPAADAAVATEEEDQEKAEGEGEKKPAVATFFLESRSDRNNRMAQSQLAKEVLAEIPEQIVSYMKSKGIAPNMVRKEKTKKEEELSEVVEAAPTVEY